MLSPADGQVRDIGEAVAHLTCLRTLRLRANMRRLTIREAAFEAGPLHRLLELDLLHVDYASAAKGESLFIFAMIHNSSAPCPCAHVYSLAVS